MIKNFLLAFILLFFLASCQNDNKESKLNISDLKSFLSQEENILEVKESSFYKVVVSTNNNERDIWITSPKKEIYDSVLSFYNISFNTNFSDTVFNSWITYSNEIMLYRKSDSIILVTIYKN